MIKRWSKQHTLILVAFLAAAAVIYGLSYFYIMKPLQEESTNLGKEISMYVRQYNRIINEPEISIGDKKSTNILVKLPNQELPDKILANLQVIANTNQVTINKIETVETDDEQAELPDDINAIVFKLAATVKELSAMNAFLTDLKNSDRLITIDTIKLNQSESEVSLELTFAAYNMEE